MEIFIWLVIVGAVICVFAAYEIPWHVWVLALFLWWMTGWA